jgi:hypothetical protein
MRRLWQAQRVEAADKVLALAVERSDRLQGRHQRVVDRLPVATRYQGEMRLPQRVFSRMRASVGSGERRLGGGSVIVYSKRC